VVVVVVEFCTKDESEEEETNQKRKNEWGCAADEWYRTAPQSAVHGAAWECRYGIGPSIIIINVVVVVVGRMEWKGAARRQLETVGVW